MQRRGLGRIDDASGGGASDTVLATRTGAAATYDSGDLSLAGLSYVAVYVDVTSIGTASLTLHVDGKDPASGLYQTLATFNTITANGQYLILIGPGLTGTPAGNATVSGLFVPATFRIQVVHNNANPADYSVAYSVVW